ncbi:MAG: type I-B CRISPR-associated protein Cas5b [Candidatus Omnitrophica bacterium]|nr:type I-B CRISPR-associated protein Cas5b [Candidatus Omnitrophota bacterium]
MKVLIFDIFGDYGHFRKFYTTSSPLTFCFPPPPTIYGILGAILGIDKNEYLEKLNGTRIAVQIVKPVKKVRIGLNLINTKDNCWTLVSNKYHEPRTQILTEFIKEPYYRIFVSHTDDTILSVLAENIKNHKTVYTISLGLSELISDFCFVSYCNVQEKKSSEYIELSTVVPFSLIQPNGIEVEAGKKYIKEKIPAEMKPGRIVSRYEDVLFDTYGQSLKVNLKNYWELENGTKITFI